ncbi:MAG: hypothetical protein U0R19_09325 [Bryobacteraceae bacterium]
MRHLAVLLMAASSALGADCAAIPLELGTFDGSFAGAECKGQDFLPDVSTTNIAAVRALNGLAFEVTVPEPGGIFHLRLTTPGVLPIAVFANEKLEVLATATAQLGAAGEFSVSVKAGKHRILIVHNNAAAAGAFSLFTELLERRSCDIPDVNLDQVVTGDLNANDCRLIDLQTPSTGVLPVDAYRIKVESFTLFAFAAASNTFRPVLALLNAKTGATVHSGQNTNSGGQAQLTISLPEGEYLLIMISGGVSPTGTYAMRALRDSPRTCNPESLSPGASVRSALTNSDCRFLDFVPFSENFSFIRPYTFELTERSLFAVDQISTQFDSYLALLREDKSSIAEDDDSAGAGNSRIALLLRPGKYTILANSYEEGAIGSFELRTVVAAPRECAVTDFPLTGVLNSAITADDCRVRDLIEEEPAANPAKAFRFTLESAMRITVEISSTVFDARLLLLDAKGKSVPLESTQIRAGTVRSSAQLTAGTYTVVAYSNTGTLGTFTLTPTLAP